MSYNEELVDVEDTGGQPMFHEVLPVFIKNTMFGMLIVKLNEPLDSFPLVEYYRHGQCIGEPFIFTINTLGYTSPLHEGDTINL